MFAFQIWNLKLSKKYYKFPILLLKIADLAIRFWLNCIRPSKFALPFRIFLTFQLFLTFHVFQPFLIFQLFLIFLIFMAFLYFRLVLYFLVYVLPYLVTQFLYPFQFFPLFLSFQFILLFPSFRQVPLFQFFPSYSFFPFFLLIYPLRSTTHLVVFLISPSPVIFCLIALLTVTIFLIFLTLIVSYQTPL